MDRWRKAVAAAMASCFLLSTTAFTAAEAGAALKDAGRLTVRQGPVRGVVLTGEGKGLGKAVVDVRDSKGEVLGAGVTKADGSFCLAAVPAGEYVLSVNGDLTYALHVAKDAEAGSVSVVVPSQTRYSAGQEEVGGPGTTAIVAGAVVLGGVVGTAVLLSDSGDDCE